MFCELIRQQFCTKPLNFIMQDKLVRMWDRLWCFDASFLLSLAEYSCDGQVLHQNNSEKDGWTFGSTCRGECLSVVGLSVSLNPIFSLYLVVWKLENCGMVRRIWDVSMCRMQPFLAIFRSFFNSSLLCTFSCHPSPPTIRPSSLTSSCHLFLGLSLNLVVPKFIYNTLLGILFSSILCTCPNQRNLFNLIVSIIVGFF